MVMSGRQMARKSSGSTVMSSPRSRVAPEDAGRAKRGDPVGSVPQQLAQDRIGVLAEARRARRPGDGALGPDRRGPPVGPAAPPAPGPGAHRALPSALGPARLPSR